ncbi:MAG: serine/threonine protein kinase [Clostridium sp.]
MDTEGDKYFKKKEVVNGYTIIKLMGQGRYGIAYLAENENGEKVIIKQLKKDMLEETREKLYYEEQILKYVNHEGFPRFISKFKDEYREGYILEYMEGRVFEDLLMRGIIFKRNDIYTICDQLLNLLEILHNKNIVHRDIRLPNVIVKDNRELVLIDFGLARVIDDKRYVKQVDYWYLADFLIHLYYSTFKYKGEEEKPWYDELDLTNSEIRFLKKLMGLRTRFKSIDEIRIELKKLKDELNSLEGE